MSLRVTLTLFLSLFLASCNLDIESDKQLIKGSKIGALENTNTLYGYETDGLSEAHLKLATPSEKASLPENPAYMKDVARLRKVLDCYVYEPLDNSEKLYTKFQHIKGSLYMLGYSEDGCFKKR